jgi:valyl-tRNA synthetase
MLSYVSVNLYPCLFSRTFRHVLTATDEEIVVATTRLETMLGDVAVAVHPKVSAA